jgi:Domain of unknown function (DUF4129)
MNVRRRILLGVALLAALSLPATSSAQEEVEEGGYEYLDEDQVRLALEETLSQPEFSRLRSLPEEKAEESESPEWLERFWRWLDDWFGADEEREDNNFAVSTSGIEVLVYVLAAVIFGAVIVFILKSLIWTARDRRIQGIKDEAPRSFRPGSAPGEVDPADYLRRAMAFGESGRFKDGVRELLLGAMSATERRGLIRFRKGLTNRDYFYSVRGPARESFARIAAEFERIYFGRREASPETFRECLTEYQRSFSGASA